MLKKISYLILCVALLTGCSTKDPFDPTAGYPRNAKITYRVSSITTGGTASIEYTNETGGETTLKEEKLPFSKTIEKKVEFAEIFSVYAQSNTVNSLTLEIEVNGKVQESKRFDESGRVSGSLYYQFE